MGARQLCEVLPVSEVGGKLRRSDSQRLWMATWSSIDPSCSTACYALKGTAVGLVGLTCPIFWFPEMVCGLGPP